MTNEYLRAFVIGSSFLIFAPYFYIVSQFDPNKINYNYNSYTFVAPIGLGLMNIISLYLAKKYNLTAKKRFRLMSLLSPTCVLLSVYIFKMYNFSQNDWIEYICKLYLLYFIIFNFVMYNLDKFI